MKGKTLLFIVFLSVFLVSYLICTFFGYTTVWKLWHIPVMMPTFADTRAITSGSEASALGYDPLFNNVRDPWHRPMNLSRLWNVLFYFRLNQSHTNLLATIFISSFFLSPFIFIKKLDKLTACVLSCAFISPAIMLGVERGTPDLFLFFILATAIRVGYVSIIAALCLIVFAGFLKLFPIFGIGLILKEKISQFWILLSITCISFLSYLVFTFSDVKQMIRVTPKGTDFSYGYDVFILASKNYFKNSSYLPLLKIALPIFSYFLLLSILVIAILLVFKNPVHDEDENEIEKNKYIDAFRVGAGIYIGTFLFGHNWDYRLMFLIFTIPQIVTWIKQKNSRYFLAASFTLPTIILSFWYLILARIINYYLTFNLGLIIDEFFNWVVFSGLVYLFLASLPNWLCNIMYKLVLAVRQRWQILVG
ncbi:hypothetical protein [Nostoc sp. NMS4]|uniref:hypothetical protein n=1 Tax=Nostoc sp. NMS4 TaxID=2815390 RepID=UPI0025DFA271|nr:hypothetical protein [Nostoc sp. NMS4]MBN3924662.1 hypothetical protein [Nostoc sp. NMS4]